MKKTKPLSDRIKALCGKIVDVAYDWHDMGAGGSNPEINAPNVDERKLDEEAIQYRYCFRRIRHLAGLAGEYLEKPGFIRDLDILDVLANLKKVLGYELKSATLDLQSQSKVAKSRAAGHLEMVEWINRRIEKYVI